LISPLNPTKLAWKRSHAVSLQPPVNISGWMTARQHQWRRKEVNSGSLFLQIWQFREATLNQWLRSFPIKSRAEILPRCRRDYPLPPPINRGFVDDLREEKIGSKVGQKLAPLPPFLQFFSLPLSPRRSSHHQLLHHQLHHR